MRTVKEMVDWLLGERRSEIPPAAIIRMGIVHTRVGRVLLCDPEYKFRGVKLVSVSVDLLGRYNQALRDDARIQAELHALPKKRRPRKRKLKIVSLPPNPEPSLVEATT